MERDDQIGNINFPPIPAPLDHMKYFNASM